MFRLKLRRALVAFTAIAALALPASALATDVTTWQIVQQNDPAAANTDLAPDAVTLTELVSPPLTGNYPGGAEPNPAPLSLVYGHQTFGVDLTYAPSSGSSLNYQWEFIRQPGTYVTQQIAVTERVALYDTANHKYLARACNTDGCIGGGTEAYGINLIGRPPPATSGGSPRGATPQPTPMRTFATRSSRPT